ncbi:MAG TPA: hypothetical protein VLE99_02475 [Candidatus Saccharimonadales bacterium]|nr:hypothetical protein [Candidatus Saccharimonadales bacterium]
MTVSTAEIYNRPVDRHVPKRFFGPQLVRERLGSVVSRVVAHSTEAADRQFDVDVSFDNLQAALEVMQATIAEAQAAGDEGSLAQKHLARFALHMADINIDRTDVVTLRYYDMTCLAEQTAAAAEREAKLDRWRAQREADPMYDRNSGAADVQASVVEWDLAYGELFDGVEAPDNWGDMVATHLQNKAVLDALDFPTPKID